MIQSNCNRHLESYVVAKQNRESTKVIAKKNMTSNSQDEKLPLRWLKGGLKTTF